MVFLKYNSKPVEFYDLIILDLNMHLSNGYIACKRIHNLLNIDVKLASNLIGNNANKNKK